MESERSSLHSSKKALFFDQNDGVPGSKFLRDPDNYTVEQLKRWLKCRGQKVSGKRNDLIARVRGCVLTGDHQILDPSIDGGK